MPLTLTPSPYLNTKGDQGPGELAATGLTIATVTGSAAVVVLLAGLVFNVLTGELTTLGLRVAAAGVGGVTAAAGGAGGSARGFHWPSKPRRRGWKGDVPCGPPTTLINCAGTRTECYLKSVDLKVAYA